MSDDVKRVYIDELGGIFEPDDKAEHALLPWEQYEQLLAENRLLKIKVDALLGSLSAIQTQVNQLPHYYKYSDFFDKRIRQLMERVAKIRMQAIKIAELESDDG